MAVKEPTPPIESAGEELGPTQATLEPGFHVMHEGVSLGCYASVEDAEAFADGHPRADGLTVSVEEVKG